jgi:hypothetical protein
VPFSQLSAEAAHFVFFEDLVLEPDATFGAVAAYLGIEVDHPAFQRAVDTATETDFLKRGHRADREHLLGDWRQHLTPSQVDRGREIINAFGLDHLYDEYGRPTGLTPMRAGS